MRKRAIRVGEGPEKKIWKGSKKKRYVCLSGGGKGFWHISFHQRQSFLLYINSEGLQRRKVAEYKCYGVELSVSSWITCLRYPLMYM